MAATFRAFLTDHLAAKKAREYHVEMMHRGLDQANVDMATQWAGPSVEPPVALFMIALYENHTRWRLDVVAGEWRHINPPAQAPAQGIATRGPPGPAPQQHPNDQIRAAIVALDARLLQLRGPSTPPPPLGEMQRVANTQLHYAWQCRLVETLVIFLRTEAPQHGYGQCEFAAAHADGTWAALWPILGMKDGEFPARHQTVQATKAGPTWGLLQVWIARPLGARVHHAAILVLPAATVPVATHAGTSTSTMRTPGGWVLGARGRDLVHGLQHRSHL